VQVGTAAYGNIGDVTVRTVNGLSLFAGSANHSGNIGNIAITGTDEIDGQQFLSVAANMVGRISAGANKGDGDSLTLNLGVNTVSVGAIIVANADSGEKAHLALAGGETLLALNNISVDGNLTFVSSIESLRIIGTISANSILSSGATIGAGGAGTSIGLISLATSSGTAGRTPSAPRRLLRRRSRVRSSRRLNSRLPAYLHPIAVAGLARAAERVMMHTRCCPIAAW
jgi:hypothetical protein